MSERIMPEGFGGALWADQTMVHPVGLAVLIATVIALLLVPRKHAVLPLVILAVAIPSVQRIVIGSLDFSFIRIAILAALSVAAVRGHWRGLQFARPDVLILGWMCWGLVAYGILMGGFGGVITRAGYMIDTVGAYILGRVYLRSTDDLRRLIICLAIIAVPMFLFFMVERVTGKNMFSVFGGVPAETMIRNGRLRVQGPFSHPVLAGVFWASLLPLLGAYWMGRPQARTGVFIALLCIGLIVVNTASSTPVMSVLFGMFGMSLFYARRYMTYIRYGIIATLGVLHMVMEAPVWHLIARIDLSNGSTGWHRYNLIQQSINHFGEWWQVGTTSTAHWGWGLQDITNQYVLEGVNGGIAGLTLFTLFLWTIFSRLGRAIPRQKTTRDRWLLWAAGVSMFVHCMSFLAVSYFGQTVALFYLFAGAVVSISFLPARHKHSSPVAQPRLQPQLPRPALAGH